MYKPVNFQFDIRTFNFVVRFSLLVIRGRRASVNSKLNLRTSYF